MYLRTYVSAAGVTYVRTCTYVYCVWRTMLHGWTQYKSDQASAKLDLSFTNVDPGLMKSVLTF